MLVLKITLISKNSSIFQVKPLQVPARMGIKRENPISVSPSQPLARANGWEESQPLNMPLTSPSLFYGPVLYTGRGKGISTPSSNSSPDGSTYASPEKTSISAYVP